jgi:glycine cleavage system aminomethyltransferase T
MVKQSALLDFYRARGATMVEHQHWLLPAHFGDPVAEYDAVRNDVGVLDLCQRNLLRVTGHDRTAFINGTFSNDVSALTAGRGLHGAFLDPHGKILADARVFDAADFILVYVPEARKETVLQHLQRHLAGDVEIEDLFADFTMLSVQGPRAERLISEAAPTHDLSSLDLAHMEVTIAGSNVTLIVVTHGGERGYDLVIPMAVLADVVSRIEEVGKRWSLSWVGTEAQEMLRIETGIPLYGVDITEKNSLLETGQDRWVNFNRRLCGFVLQSKQTSRLGPKSTTASSRLARLLAVASHRIRIQPSLSVIYDGIISFPRTRVLIRHGEKSLEAMVSFLPIY